MPICREWMWDYHCLRCTSARCCSNYPIAVFIGSSDIICQQLIMINYWPIVLSVLNAVADHNS